MKESWGGKREGAGRKPGWKNGPCKAVKIPAALVGDVMRYAHQLDAGQAPTPPGPVTKASAEETQRATWPQLSKLVDEKQALSKRVLQLEEALSKERRKGEQRERRLEQLKQAIRYASLILSDALADHEKGVRRGVSVKDARHALNALSSTLIE